MSANGRVITGFSHPIYSLFAASAEATRTYAVLARGVDVSVAVESSDDTTFYADNGIAESIGGGFTTGTLTLTVDGLLETAENAIYGRTAAGTDDWKSYKSTDSVPYVSIGFIVRYISDGTTTYVPVILNKVKFKQEELAAATEGESIEFQTQSLEATIFENDSNVWKMTGEACSTEAAAITALQTKIITA